MNGASKLKNATMKINFAKFLGPITLDSPALYLHYMHARGQKSVNSPFKKILRGIILGSGEDI